MPPTFDAHPTARDVDSRASAPSRRTVLLGAAAAGAGAAGVVATPGPAGAALPLVRPLSAQAVLDSFGVNARPSFLSTGYTYYRAWLNRIAGMGATSFRGYYTPGQAQTLQIIAEARRLGLRWDMVVALHRSDSAASIQRTVRHIATNAADVCRSIKGLNEPNYDRASGPVLGDWETPTVGVQRYIWDAVQAEPQLAGVTVVGPTLQDATAVESDYRRLADLGLLNVMDVGAIHRYPGGSYPDHLMDDRLAMLRRTWPGKEIWIAETGYTNAVASTTGARTVPESVAATYAPSALLEAVDRGCKTAFFEALDDPDLGEKDLAEANFGLWALKDGTSPPWRAKPIVGRMRTLLTSLRDPGPAFTPPRVVFQATGPSDLRVTLTAKRDGTVTAHLRRAVDCWDTKTRSAVVVPKAQVRIETATGVRYVYLDQQMRSVIL